MIINITDLELSHKIFKDFSRTKRQSSSQAKGSAMKNIENKQQDTHKSKFKN
jgi:hypothetical protein